MKKVFNTLTGLALILLAGVLFNVLGQETSTSGFDTGAEKITTDALINIALGIAGVASSIVVMVIRNNFEISSTTSFFIYLALSIAIAVGVSIAYGAFNTKDIASSLAIIFTVGQAVYQSFLKEKPEVPPES